MIEAQVQGLPCFTLGPGGNRLAACPEAGVSQDVATKEEFYSRSAECLAAWQADPVLGQKQSAKALEFAARFNQTRLQDYVRDLIVPVFAPSQKS